MKSIVSYIARYLPIYIVVAVLAIAALPKELYSHAETPPNRQVITTQPDNYKKKTPEPDIANKGVADVAKMTLESVKDKYDSIKDLYEKLFAVIAALGALFAFLGFKGADSFIQAKQKAEETLKKAEDAQNQINKFLNEIYPKNNRAEINVATGIVLRHIADSYSKIILKDRPDYNIMSDKDYCKFLNDALHYLDSADKDAGIDVALRNRTATTKGNIFKLLGEYEKAVLELEQRIRAGAKDDDVIMFNLACYYTLIAEKSAKSGNPEKAAETEGKALDYLKEAINLEPTNAIIADNDSDFEYFKSKSDQRFNSLIKSNLSTPCPMKHNEKCPMF